VFCLSFLLDPSKEKQDILVGCMKLTLVKQMTSTIFIPFCGITVIQMSYKLKEGHIYLKYFNQNGIIHGKTCETKRYIW